MPHLILILLALVALFLIIVAIQPAGFRVSRSTSISAPAAAVFDQVNDFHNWEAWSPYTKLDPALRRDYQGPATGVGAIYSWSGNSKAGQGRTTIIESVPGELIRIKLEMMKPFVCSNDVEFTFKPQGEQTVTTWSMTGKKNFFTKGIGLFCSMDKMAGGEFAKGLEQLKAILESGVGK